MKNRTGLKIGAAICLAGFLCIVPVFASGNVGGIYSDTTQPMQKNYGEQYVFQVSGLSKGDTYTVGNGKVLETFTKQSNSKTALYGFHCVGEGETGVYITHGGKVTRLFTVKVINPISLKQVVGADASRFQKLQIYHHAQSKTITNQKEIQTILQEISPIQLRRLPKDPKMSGGEYTIHFYPKDGSGAYGFSDGGSGQLYKEPGCTWNGPTGYYQIQESSLSLWIKTMKEAFAAK
jgi:hypothetical protein